MIQLGLHPHLSDQTMAFILAGGRGSRLMELTEDRAKPALPFGGQARVIDFALSNTVNSGIKNIGVAIQYQASSLMSHLIYASRYLRLQSSADLEILSPSMRELNAQPYLGAADAVYQNLAIIQSHKPQYLIILAGDHIYKMNYALMLQQHVDAGADATLACLTIDQVEAHRFGIVQIDQNDHVTSFVEKPNFLNDQIADQDKCLASMGIYIFTFDFLLDQLRRDAADIDSQHDFGKNIIPSCIGHGKVIAHHFDKSCVCDEQSDQIYWRDIGELDSYWQANIDLTRVNCPLDLHDPLWPIWSMENARPLSHFSDIARVGSDQICDSKIMAGCQLQNICLQRSFLFAGARLHSSATLTNALILPHVQIGSKARLKNVILDSFIKIPDGLIVGEDIEFDAKYFRRTTSGLCLITQKMIDRLHS